MRQYELEKRKQKGKDRGIFSLAREENKTQFPKSANHYGGFSIEVDVFVLLLLSMCQQLETRIGLCGSRRRK